MKKGNLEKALSSVSKKGPEFVDIYFEKSKGINISFQNKKLDKIITNSSEGFGLRGIYKDEVYYISKGNISSNSLNKAVIEFPELEHKRKINNLKLNSLRSVNFSVKINPDSIPLEKKIKTLNNLQKIPYSIDSRITQVNLGYSENHNEFTIVNTNSDYVKETKRYTSLVIEVIAQEGENKQIAREVIAKISGFEIIDIDTISMIIRETTLRSLKLLIASFSPVGKMPVVLSSSAGGTMIHEAIGHSLEADIIQKGISPFYANKVEKKVASEFISVYDNPTLPYLFGSYEFDDEAVKSSKKVLIDKGILKSYLYDRLTAKKDRKYSNGNGRRAGYYTKPIPRMSNTYIAPGRFSPKEIIGCVEKGILVKKMGGGQVNTANGDFVFEIEEGYTIEKGNVGNLIKGAILIGNGPEVLKSITKIGKDLKYFAPGKCGKDGQLVPVSDGQPTLLIPSLIVGGKT